MPVQEIECPNCGAALPFPGPGARFLECCYCGTTSQLRAVAPPAPPPSRYAPARVTAPTDNAAPALGVAVIGFVALGVLAAVGMAVFFAVTSTSGSSRSWTSLPSTQTSSGPTPPLSAAGTPEPVDPQTARRTALQDAYAGLTLSCYTMLSESAYRSRARYRAWVKDDQGPKAGGPIYGLYALSEPKQCANDVAAVSTEDDLHGPASKYLQTYRAAREQAAQARRYYEDKDYKDDAFARGKTMHKPLLEAFAAFETADQALATALDARLAQLKPWHLDTLSADGDKLRFELAEVGETIARRCTVSWRDVPKVDGKALDAEIKKLAELLDTAENSKALNSTFLRSGREFLTSAKEFARAVRAGGYPRRRGSTLRRAGSQWMVDGSPAEVLSEYNDARGFGDGLRRRKLLPEDLIHGRF